MAAASAGCWSGVMRSRTARCMVEFEVRVHTDRLAKPMDLAKQVPSAHLTSRTRLSVLRYVIALRIRLASDREAL
jgi:hypothetical protein